jgi:hypothetical protein
MIDVVIYRYRILLSDDGLCARRPVLTGVFPVQRLSVLLATTLARCAASKINLDNYRNRIIYINLHLSMFGVGLALATTVAGVFGMNLTSGLEEHPSLFWTTSAASVGLAAAVYLGTWAHVSRAFPSWNRSILTEIYLCHACSYHEDRLRMETPGQVRRLGRATAANHRLQALHAVPC